MASENTKAIPNIMDIIVITVFFMVRIPLILFVIKLNVILYMHICILTVSYFFQHAMPPAQGAHRKILTKQVCTTILTEIALHVNLFFAALSNKTVFDELAAASRKSVTYQHKCS